MIMIMNTTNKPLANIVMFNLTTPKEMRFGFLLNRILKFSKELSFKTLSLELLRTIEI